MAKQATLTKSEELVFLWEGNDKRGVRVKGEMRGPNTHLIKAELRRQGIMPVRIKKKSKPLLAFGDAIKPKDIMLFSRQLCTMLNSGIALVQALDMVGHSTKKPKLKEMVLGIKTDVEGGSSLAEALGKRPLQFNELYRSLIRAGEEAGVLEILLEKISVYLEKAEALKAKVKKAFTYPAIVLFFAFVVTSILLIYVIPTFEGLFKDFGADLPALTKLVIQLSQGFQTYWYLILGVPIGAIFTLAQLRKRSRKLYQMMDRAVLRLPLLGPLTATAANARFARTLATMFEGGVPLVDAMMSVAGATGNYVYQQAVLEMRDAVSIGQQLHFAMRQSGLFPDMVVQMVAIGEEAGSLGAMLTKVAEFYEAEVDHRVDTLTTYIEPALMGFLAVVVGGLVVAMYLPIFKIASAI